MTQESTAIRLIPRQQGGWLALSPRDEAVQIGVAGATEHEAREGLLLALTAWKETLDSSQNHDGASSANGSDYASAA